ncbi:MAG: 4Fe-4S dicluster domain-containing protein [Deferribacterales bacterium]
MDKDILLIMQEDIKRSLSKDPSKVKWGMLIDLRKCVGCHACTVGCISENVLPPQVIYRPVFETENGKYPNIKRNFIPRPCQQCDNPPCVAACPNKGKATFKDKNGVVVINYTKCIGCGQCVPACPYKARSMDKGKFYTENTPALQPYETRVSYEYGGEWKRENFNLPAGNARKCHFCVNRLAEGMLPMCVTTCIGRANYFGDLNDPESLIVKKMKENKTVTMQKVTDDTPKTGNAVFGPSKTKPSVFYIL